MNLYRRTVNKYRALGLEKNEQNISNRVHLMAIFGIDIDEDIEGLNLLDDTEREFVKNKGIYGLLNRGGLLAREEYLTIKVEKDKYNRYKLWTNTGYSWLYPDGSIG